MVSFPEHAHKMITEIIFPNHPFLSLTRNLPVRAFAVEEFQSAIDLEDLFQITVYEIFYQRWDRILSRTAENQDTEKIPAFVI